MSRPAASEAAAPRRVPSPGRPAVFLDRDGVLNRALVRDGKPYPPDGLAQAELLPGVAEACRALSAAGALLICVTNQPDIGRGTRDPAEVTAINDWLRRELGLDAVRVCPHDGVTPCDCRKPEPGLLLRAAGDYGIDLTRSAMVGDRWRDVEAGQRAGCLTVFIDYGYAERRPDSPDMVVPSLLAALPCLLARIGAPGAGPSPSSLGASAFPCRTAG